MEVRKQRCCAGEVAPAVARMLPRHSATPPARAGDNLPTRSATQAPPLSPHYVMATKKRVDTEVLGVAPLIT